MARILFVLLLSCPLMSSFGLNLPGLIGGGLSTGLNTILSGGAGTTIDPNYNIFANLFGGLASAISGIVNAVANGHAALDAAVVNGIANSLLAALNTVTDIFRTGGLSGANVTAALGQAATDLGNALGPITVGANGGVTAAVQAAASKFVNVLFQIMSNPLSASYNFSEILKIILDLALGVVGGVQLGPLGSVNLGGGVSGLANVVENAMAAIGIGK